MNNNKLVIFGASNILSDLWDAAMANGLTIAKTVIDAPAPDGERDISLQDRLAKLARHGQHPLTLALDDFQPEPGELYLLGPTTPTRISLARRLEQKFGLHFHTLIHPSASVSPMAVLSAGVFIGANSVIGPGASLAEHVFVNRGVTIGHDTVIGAFSRIQPGSNLGGLSRYGAGVTVGIGATVLERLVIGDGAFIGAGAVVIDDVPASVLMVGIPARIKKRLDDVKNS
jgi:sugar O-acyltransferase (sialic acid O-acetyltransferase NeuD family)